MPTARRAKPNDAAGQPKRDAGDDFVGEIHHPHGDIIRALRATILAADSRIREGVKWNAPSFYTTEHFATFHLRAKDGIQLVLHLGARKQSASSLRASLPETGDLLQWKSPDRAVVAFPDVAAVQTSRELLSDVIRIWITHVHE